MDQSKSTCSDVTSCQLDWVVGSGGRRRASGMSGNVSELEERPRKRTREDVDQSETRVV